MAKKPAEYKDTFTFRLFPEYTYTKAQQRRFRLFQGSVKRWRKAINYADAFNDPNRINLLYMIGYTPKIKEYLEKTNSNLVVLCAKIPQELLELYDAYWKLIGRQINRGLADKEGNLLPAYYRDREIREKHREHFQEAMAEDALIDRYEASKRAIINCFSVYTVMQKGVPECTISHENLDKFIKQFFSYGREQRNVGEKVFGSLKRVADAIQVGLERSDAAKLFGFPAGTDCAQVFQKEIKRCQMNLNVMLRENGTANLVTIMARMKAPPYGWDTELHAAYCFGYVIHDYLDAWYWDGVGCFPMRDVAQSVLRSILTGYATSNFARRRAFVLLTETGWKLSERFAYLFDIGTDEFCPRDETDRKILELRRAGMTERQIANELGIMTNIAVHKRLAKMQTSQKCQVPFCNMAVQVCKKIEQTTQWPISLVDNRLTETIVGAFDENHHVCVPIFGRCKTREALSYFTVEKCCELKKILTDLDTYVSYLIHSRYGSSVDVDEIRRICTTRSSGWLWDAEIFWDCVDRHMAKEN